MKIKLPKPTSKTWAKAFDSLGGLSKSDLRNLSKQGKSNIIKQLSQGKVPKKGKS